MEPSQMTPNDDFRGDQSQHSEYGQRENNNPQFVYNDQDDGANFQNMPRQMNFNQRISDMENTEEMGPVDHIDSNMVSNMGTERPISMPVSGPLSAGRMIIDNQQMQQQSQPNNPFAEQQRQMTLQSNLEQEARMQQNVIDRSAQASTIPLQQLQMSTQPVNNSSSFMNSSSSQGAQLPNAPGPSPLVRQLSDKVRSQAERLQVMEAYKALCEQRILELDPDHPMPMMPFHLGTPAIGVSDMGETGPADLKRQLALKEQDLYYTKQRNEKLFQENEQLRNGGQTNNQFDALRKEIELNERLQKQIEIYKQQLHGQSQNDKDQPKSLSSRKHSEPKLQTSRSMNSDNRPDQRDTNRNPSDAGDNEMKTLREQLNSLAEEKNTLLDYINENIDKFGSLSQKKNSAQTDSNNQLVMELKAKINALENQNENLVRQQYQSPEFGHQSTDTFGNQDQFQKHFQDAKSQFLKEKETLSTHLNQQTQRIQQLEHEINGIKTRYEEVVKENNQLNVEIAQQPQKQQQSDQKQSDRSQAQSQQASDQSDKKISNLENKLKATQENLKTLSQTLTETQNELESLLNEHQNLKQDYQKQLSDHTTLHSMHTSNLKLLDGLKDQNSQLEEDLKKTSNELNSLKDQHQQSQKDKKYFEDRALQFQGHINDLKEQENERMEKITGRWEETVGDLSKELDNTKKEFQSRQLLFNKLEEDMKKKLDSVDQEAGKQTQLQDRIEGLNTEIQMLQNQKQEKDQKLKGQIRKNEELLGELQELSEAVHALKNDKSFSASAQILEEREEVIQHYHHYLSNNQKRALDRVFSTILKTVEHVREFSKIHKIDDEKYYSLFEMMDKSLKNIANSQKKQSSKAKENKDSKLRDPKSMAKEQIKESVNLFQDLESLTQCISQWNTIVLNGYKTKIGELNETQKELFKDRDQNKTLIQELDKFRMNETQNVQKDQTVKEELHGLHMTIIQKENEMKDIYKREDKLNRQNHKIKSQLDHLLKEQEKLVMQIKALVTEKDRMVQEREKQNNREDQMDVDKKKLEFNLCSQQEQMEQIHQMVENLKQSMPSEDLQILVGEMQNITMENFNLNEQFGQKETELISMENQLRQLAKSDTGLSKKVIQLRKDIQKSREALKEMQVKRIQLADKKEDVVNQLKSCEVMERRRNDVALETEKTLIEAKEKMKDMEKELIFVNNNRKDLQAAIVGFQDQIAMLQRELSTLRMQLTQGNFMNTNQSQNPTLGAALSKARTQRDNSRPSSNIMNHPPLHPGSNHNLHQITKTSNTAVINTQRQSMTGYSNAPSSVQDGQQTFRGSLEQNNQTPIFNNADEQQLQTLQRQSASHRSRESLNGLALQNNLQQQLQRQRSNSMNQYVESQESPLKQQQVPTQYNHQMYYDSNAQQQNYQGSEQKKIVVSDERHFDSVLQIPQQSHIKQVHSYSGAHFNYPSDQQDQIKQIVIQNQIQDTNRLSSFDKNQRVNISEQQQYEPEVLSHQRNNNAFRSQRDEQHPGQNQLLDTNQIPQEFLSQFGKQQQEQQNINRNQQNQYGTFGGQTLEGVNSLQNEHNSGSYRGSGHTQKADSRNYQQNVAIDPSPSMPNIQYQEVVQRQASELRPQQMLDDHQRQQQQYAMGANYQQRPQNIDSYATYGNHTSLRQQSQQVQMAQPPIHPSTQTEQQNLEADDSFRSDAGQQRIDVPLSPSLDQSQYNDDNMDNSLLLRSELLERNDNGSIEQSAAATNQQQRPGSSSLQDKLSQVKNVFTAIRQNLNEGSTEKSN